VATNALAGRSGRDRGGAFARRLLQEYGLVLVLVLLIAVVSIREPSFIEGQSILNMLQQWAPIGLMAVAGTFVIISGGFDFSVGGTYALGAVLSAGLAQTLPVTMAFVLALLAGLAIGVANGLVVTKAHVNPFIATLGMGQVARGIALVYTAGVPFVVERDSFSFLGTHEIAGVAISTVILVSAFLVGGFVLARTIYGRTIYAIGGNSEASRLSGIKVDRRLIAAYAVSGVAAAMAGALVASRLGTGQADAGAGIEFDVVIAIVLGGTAISGGFGSMWRTGVGLGLLAVMQNGFDSLQINPFYQVVIKGAVLIGAVAWDEYVRRQKVRIKRAAPAAPAPAPSPGGG
jgi:ribose transport system permease protein